MAGHGLIFEAAPLRPDAQDVPTVQFRVQARRGGSVACRGRQPEGVGHEGGRRSLARALMAEEVPCRRVVARLTARGGVGRDGAAHRGARAEGGSAHQGARPAKKGAHRRPRDEQRAVVDHLRAGEISAGRGCRMIGLPRSTYYRRPRVAPAAIAALQDDGRLTAYRVTQARRQHRASGVQLK